MRWTYALRWPKAVGSLDGFEGGHSWPSNGIVAVEENCHELVRVPSLVAGFGAPLRLLYTLKGQGPWKSNSLPPRGSTPGARQNFSSLKFVAGRALLKLLISADIFGLVNPRHQPSFGRRGRHHPVEGWFHQFFHIRDFPMTPRKLFAGRCNSASKSVKKDFRPFKKGRSTSELEGDHEVSM